MFCGFFGSVCGFRAIPLHSSIVTHNLLEWNVTEVLQDLGGRPFGTSLAKTQTENEKEKD